MKTVTRILLASAAGLAVVPVAHAADLPARKAAPVEYVRVCSAFGAGFFYIPGTDTCLRVSGRARFEYGYQGSYSRSGTAGDYSGYRSIGRLNLDARTQTAYGTLRAFVRFEMSSRTGIPTLHSGTQNRIANAFPAFGVDTFGRAQTVVNADKAFIQFAGFTAGRAASFYDFYAHDFEFIASTMSSDVASTNLAAYTATLGQGFSATLSVEDSIARKTPIYAPTSTAGFPGSVALSPIFLGYNAAGLPTGIGTVDVIQRSRMPDFVGALRYDGGWGSAQVSAAVHELNTGNPVLGSFTGTNLGAALSDANKRTLSRTATEYGWAVQGGVKINLPFIAAGDTLYLQGAYGEGASMYTGVTSYMGSYSASASSIQGSAFSQFFSDATLNPFTNRLELSTSFSAVASLLHYWTPELRSAVFGSYGEVSFARGARAAQGAYFGLTGTGPGTPGTRFFTLSQTLRDSYRFVVGGSLIWSPVKELDIGAEAIYTRYGVQSGRVLDLSRYPGQNAAFVNNLANPVATTSSVDAFQVRARVQRDF
ncbi:Porin subfamily protein [Methylobacterium sp. 174MFSha1.1]|uniref:porin n=1 Tax=Methylobacterium sp. 174MFSha1.1 TaxID=1502749 RepID=UPI0008ECEFED|nr:porin [Methylobacterium sp. 174MFSha1.1]SFU49031.1 Porin subfamily protein [Methylobacterium sp. 174MFSha1.1]